MIPYSIQYACPSSNTRDNICIKCDYIEKTKLDEAILNFIVDFIHDFSNNITEITSYTDFCGKYWKKHGCMVRDWYYIFNVEYFEKIWIDWNVEEQQEQIYHTYVQKYKKERNL